MKRVISMVLVLVIFASFVCGCSFLPDEIKLCNINFFVDGELYATQTALLGQVISQPKSPEKENQIFVGWCTDSNLAYEYDFSTIIVADMNFYAKFVLDAVNLTNMITTQTMKSIVSVENKCYNTMAGGLVETSSATSQGSGVVINISSGYCYVLTNYHVVYKQSGFSKQSFTVCDAWGNRYEASIYKNVNGVEAVDPSYDLVLLCFKYESEEDAPYIEPIEYGEDVAIGEYVVSIGTPLGQKNAITYGNALAYKVINSEEDDETLADVLFDVVIHSALIDRGSSGGALLDSSGKLVGINFAGFDSNHHGCAIPMSKVMEFLNEYVYLR